MERIIGRYDGKEKGPLLICIGGIHGNEHAGVEAIEEVFRLLHKEPHTNPSFHYRGSFIGIRGNLEALQQRKRFINRDMNRMLTQKLLDDLRQQESSVLAVEERESIALTELVLGLIRDMDPEFTLIIDLHTTTADGGIFTICANDESSRKLALGLHAPVILGIAENIAGTTIEYFHHPGRKQYCIVFEAGQHEDPGSVTRSVAAIVNSMRSIGAVDAHDIDHRHDALLMGDAAGYPKMSRLTFHYRIHHGEDFRMNPGYKNFQRVKKGEELASNKAGPIQAPFDAMILMPKYQPLGEDGFFLVETVEV